MDFIRLVTRKNAKITTRILYQITTLLALVFFVSCIINVYSRINGIVFTFQVTEWDHTELGVAPPLGGISSLVYTFDAPSTSLSKICLFPELYSVLSNLDNSLLVTLTEDATNKCLLRERLSWNDKTFYHYALVVEFPPIVLEKKNSYRLELSMPEVSPGQGIRFFYTRSFRDLNDSLEVSGDILKGQSLALLLLPARPDLPMRTVLLGLLLFGVSLITAWRNGKGGLTAFLALGGVMVILSVYCWESRIWQSWFMHWPDGYVRIAHRFWLWLMDELSGADLTTLLARHQNGHAWIIPLFIALLSTLKLNYLQSYVTLNLLFSLGGAGLLGIYAKRIAITQQKPWVTPVFLGMLMLHLCIIRAAVSPLTDAGGLFFTILFILVYSRVLEAQNIVNLYSVAGGVIIALGCQTRIALLPLACLPLAMAIWRLCFSKEKRVAQAVAAAFPSLIGIGLLIGCWELLDLWKSIGMARGFASSEQFRQFFSFLGFAQASFSGLQLSMAAILLSRGMLFRQAFFASLVLLAFGFEAMLFMGKIIPWFRYWTPVAPLSCMIIWLWLSEKPRGYKLWLGLLEVQILANLYYVIRNPSFL